MATVVRAFYDLKLSIISDPTDSLHTFGGDFSRFNVTTLTKLGLENLTGFPIRNDDCLDFVVTNKAGLLTRILLESLGA